MKKKMRGTDFSKLIVIRKPRSLVKKPQVKENKTFNVK